MIRTAESRDIVRIAEIHSQSLPRDYLPRLGNQVLYGFYSTVWNENPIVVYDDEGDILGFVLLALSKINLRKIFFYQHKNILKKLFMQPSLWGQTLWLGLAPKDATFYPELSFIAIKQGYRDKGIGSTLIDWIFVFLKKRGFNSLYAKTEKANEKTNRFYKKNGFTVMGIETRVNKAFNVYVRRIV